MSKENIFSRYEWTPIITLTMIFGVLGLFFAYFIFSVGNNARIESKIITCPIVKKYTTERGMMMWNIGSQDVRIETPIDLPNIYRVVAQIRSTYVNIDVTRDHYSEIEAGDMIEVRYGIGRINGKPIVYDYKIIRTVSRPAD